MYYVNRIRASRLTQCNDCKVLVHSARAGNAKDMRTPGVEPGSQAWEACMIPLHYVRWQGSLRMSFLTLLDTFGMSDWHLYLLVNILAGRPILSPIHAEISF